MPLFTVFSEQSERYLTFFPYLCSRRLHYRLYGQAERICTDWCYYADLTPKLATWKDKAGNGRISSQKGNCDTTLGMILGCGIVILYIGVTETIIFGVGVRIACPDQRGNARPRRVG